MEFRVVPSHMLDRLRQGKVIIRNWHALNWETEEQVAKKRSVDKRGARSDDAYVTGRARRNGQGAQPSRSSTTRRITHGAFPPGRRSVASPSPRLTRRPSGSAVSTASTGRAAFSPATTSRPLPLRHPARRSTSEALFDWIVSDFGLNDAIESGLVKTPRVVVRDDAVPRPPRPVQVAPVPHLQRPGGEG